MIPDVGLNPGDVLHHAPLRPQVYFHACKRLIKRLSTSCCTMAKPGLVYGTMGRIEPLLEPCILPRFLDLDQDGKTMAEYVWIGGSGSDLRSKTRVITKEVKSVKDLPIWNYDGSSTGQGARCAPSGKLCPPVRLICRPVSLHWSNCTSTHVITGFTIKSEHGLS